MPVFANACTPLPAWHVFSWGHSPPACCSSPSPATVPCPRTPGCPPSTRCTPAPLHPQHPHQPPRRAQLLFSLPATGCPVWGWPLLSLHHRGAAGASRPDTVLMAPCHPPPLPPGGSGCSPRYWAGGAGCPWMGGGFALCVCACAHLGAHGHVHACAYLWELPEPPAPLWRYLWSIRGVPTPWHPLLRPARS